MLDGSMKVQGNRKLSDKDKYTGKYRILEYYHGGPYITFNLYLEFKR